jgi:hypothetical protein
MGKPPKSDVLGNLKWDYLEDMLRVSIASYPLAYAMCYARGSVTGGSLVWTMPAWANRLLYQARMIRYYSYFWGAGLLYYSSYNFLTGYMGWPRSEYGSFNYDATVLSALGPALLCAVLNQKPDRLWIGRRSTLAGRIFWYSINGAAAAYFWAYTVAQGNDRFGKKFDPTKDDYLYQLNNTAPGPDLVAKMPYIPLYKEFKTVPGTRIKNQLYDPEFVEKAKAEGKRVLEAHS